MNVIQVDLSRGEKPIVAFEVDYSKAVTPYDRWPHQTFESFLALFEWLDGRDFIELKFTKDAAKLLLSETAARPFM
jgi:hypothetical protein